MTDTDPLQELLAEHRAKQERLLRRVFPQPDPDDTDTPDDGELPPAA
ncbi:hypothetical protein [Streptomyces mirabilis]